jgi:hypothetical protein
MAPTGSLAGQLPVSVGTFYCGDALLVHSEGFSGEDFGCEPKDDASPSGRVTVVCTYIGGYEPEIRERTVTIVENRKVGTLTFQAEGENAVVLEACSG